MRTISLLSVLPVFAAVAPAQYAILTTSSSSTGEHTLALDLPEVDAIKSDEIYEVVPQAGVSYSARPFLPISLQWHYVGDLDGDGQYVEGSDSGPGGSSNSIDAIFVRTGPAGPVTPRDVFFSLASASTPMGVLASDVVRYAGPGVREVFLHEADLEVATGGTTLNLDAICQSAAGDLFFSFALGETLTLGSALDGDLLFIPAAAISYDMNGNVQAIAANSAQRVATEAQLLAMRTNSGFLESDGTTPTTLFNLSGLEMDPNGGTWVSPVDGLTYPDVLFTWKDTSNDGAILSTAAGGSFAMINGVAMGSAVATTGAQLGWLPGISGTAGPGGLALIPLQAQQFTLLNYPRNLHTQGDGQTFVQLETAGGAPNGFTVLAWSVESAVPGGTFPAIPAIPPFTGEFGMLSPILIGLFANDAQGNSASPLIVLPTAVMSGVNLAAQALDVGSFQLSWPSAMSFL